jgi:hypothetical protein
LEALRQEAFAAIPLHEMVVLLYTVREPKLDKVMRVIDPSQVHLNLYPCFLPVIFKVALYPRSPPLLSTPAF